MRLRRAGRSREAITKRPTPTIPAKAGIQINASWIPAFAGMVGLARAGEKRRSKRKSNMTPTGRNALKTSIPGQIAYLMTIKATLGLN